MTTSSRYSHPERADRITCACCGKVGYMEDIHTLPLGWEQGLGKNYFVIEICPECVAKIAAKLKAYYERKSNVRKNK